MNGQHSILILRTQRLTPCNMDVTEKMLHRVSLPVDLPRLLDHHFKFPDPLIVPDLRRKTCKQTCKFLQIHRVGHRPPFNLVANNEAAVAIFIEDEARSERGALVS